MFLERTNKEYEVKNKQYECQITNMRNFVIYLTKDLDTYKKKDFRESQFWKQFQTEMTLQDSEPPSELYIYSKYLIIIIIYSPTPIDMNDKN